MVRLRAYHLVFAAVLLLTFVKAEEATGAGAPCDEAHDDDAHAGGQFAHFNDIFLTVLFIVFVWLSGKVAAAAGAPSLVGEILVGVVLGPHVLDFVPFPSALKAIGEVGLCLHALEAGLMVDVEMLEIVGARGLIVGFLGSALPLGLGLLVALAWGASLTSAFVVGACMATMSTGIALNVLKAGSVINQPIGQLIIAAASVNELVNITLLTCVENMTRKSKWEAYAVPLGTMVALVMIVGFGAVYVVPRWLENHVLPRIPQHHRPNAVLLCLFGSAMVLVPLCKYSGSSELLGAFLAGLCFCSDHVVHATWDRQVKRIYAWLMRLFFAATIGFAIPVEAIGHMKALSRAGLLSCVVVAKLAMGFLAQPLDGDHFWILALAWGEWGEFSFFVAGVAAHGSGKTGALIGEDTHNAICLAVLLSMLVCPAGLRRQLEAYEARAKYQIAEAIADTADTSGREHATYFCLQTKSHAHWDMSGSLQRMMRRLGCEMIDSRQWHPNDHFGLAHCVNEMYVRDDHVLLPSVLDMTAEQTVKLRARIDAILDATRAALHEDEHDGAEIRVQRWLPGSHLEDGRLVANLDVKDRIEALASDANVYRGTDGKLHGRSHGPWRSTSHAVPRSENTDLEQCLEGFDEVASHKSSARKEGRLKAFARHVLDPSEKDHGLEAERGTRGALHVDSHHELDGFVHHGAHHPFALPDDDDHEAEDELVFGSHRSSTSLRRMASFRSTTSLADVDEEAVEWHQHDVETAADGGTVLPLAAVGDLRHSKSADANFFRRSEADKVRYDAALRAIGVNGRSPARDDEDASRAARRRKTLADLPPPPPSPPSTPTTSPGGGG